MRNGWKPVRRGSIYCSPLCGGGCLLSAYVEANRQAKAWASKLGKDWTPRVWENLGWHWCVASKNGMVTAYPPSSTSKEWWIDLHPKHYVSHQYSWHTKNPKAGIRNAGQFLMEACRKAQKAAESFPKVK